METKTRPKSYSYQVDVDWTTERKGVISAHGKPAVEVATPPEFRGHPGIWSPEDLFVSAVNVCTMTTFLALAARREVRFLRYRSRARGLLEMVDGRFKFTRVTVYPELTLPGGADEAGARALLHEAEHSCLIANSINATVQMEETILFTSPVAQ
ncbi:MAG: OsmC family protein [Acidobacteria bacterium]|nr:OsmC family protein [Acidobacteriota bacterium]